MNTDNINNTTSTTEDVVCYVLGESGLDEAYLVHIDTSALTHYRYAEIERAVTGTHHVTVIAPEHYGGEITVEVTVTVDGDGNIEIY